MTPPPACPREPELVAAAASGRLPHAPELTEHLATCDSCAAEVALVELMAPDLMREAHIASTRLRSADAVYWQARLRAQREHTATVTAPIRWMQGMLLAATLGLALSLLAPAVGWLTRLTPALDVRALLMRGLDGVAPILAHQSVLLTLGAWLVLAPLVVYFVVVQE